MRTGADDRPGAPRLPIGRSATPASIRRDHLGSHGAAACTSAISKEDSPLPVRGPFRAGWAGINDRRDMMLVVTNERLCGSAFLLPAELQVGPGPPIEGCRRTETSAARSWCGRSDARDAGRAYVTTFQNERRPSRNSSLDRERGGGSLSFPAAGGVHRRVRQQIDPGVPLSAGRVSEGPGHSVHRVLPRRSRRSEPAGVQRALQYFVSGDMV